MTVVKGKHRAIINTLIWSNAMIQERKVKLSFLTKNILRNKEK